MLLHTHRRSLYTVTRQPRRERVRCGVDKSSARVIVVVVRRVGVVHYAAEHLAKCVTSVILVIVFAMIPELSINIPVIICILNTILCVVGFMYWWGGTINGVLNIYVRA